VKQSPTHASTIQEKYKHIYQPSYINKLNAFQRALALRADLGCRLAKYGLTADYCRPELAVPVEQTQRRSYVDVQRGVSPTQLADTDGSHVPHHLQDRMMNNQQAMHQRPSLSGVRKNTVLDFNADGYVKTEY
jgi:hypothetical protein